MQAPGTDELFGDIGYSGVSLNNRGETAFIASPSFNAFNFVSRPQPITAIDDESVWTEAGGSGLRRIAQEGPGMPGDGTFTYVAHPVISDVGETLYVGSFPGDIWRNRLGQADTSVAASESIAPSTAAPYSTIRPPSVNALGEVAFFATLGPPRENLSSFQGIWAELDGGALDLVARQSFSAPGTGGSFRDLSQEPVIGLGGAHCVSRHVRRPRHRQLER
jgi:hypothetical protein